ncbi:RNA exonuclease 4 isoform X2 [Ambystoma mexicanum]
MTCGETMATITETKSALSTTAAQTGPVKNPSPKKAKKKKYWKHTVKEVPKVQGGSKAIILPPKAPQEFSSNWKALQELLKPKTSNSLLLTQSPSNKKQTTKLPKAEGSLTSKEGCTNVQPVSKDQSEEKPKGLASVTATSSQQKSTSDQKGRARKKRGKNGFIESEEEHLQQKKKKKAEVTIAKPLTEDDLWFDDVDPDDIEATLGPEAAEIARQKLGLQKEKPLEEGEPVLVKNQSFDGLTKAVAMDCEMVGVGPEGEDSIVARVSIVNYFGKCIYDKYVRPTEKVTDYRTAVSGIRPGDIKNGVPFKEVQKEVASILEGRILVGHALHNDLKILFLDHPRKKIRDTQRYKPFKQEVKSGRPSLKLLCSKLLNVKVQTSEHSSVQDAQAAMRLYTLHKKQWEASITAKYKDKKQTNKDKPATLSS